MPSSSIFSLGAGTVTATGDVLVYVDVSDTTQSPQGTTKKITLTSFFAGAFPITVTGGTVTTSTPVFQATQTWNDVAVTFTAEDLNVVDTASAAASLLRNYRVGGVSKWKVDKAGIVTQAGRLDISGSAAGQIAFPAAQNPSANANTLDDYEEGAWTPSLGGSTTYTAQTGTYLKIGKWVLVTGVITVNVLGTGSTTAISGLPFTASGLNHGVSVAYFENLASSVVCIVGAVGSGSTTITLRSLAAAGATVSANAIFGNSARVDFTAVYEATG